MRHKTKMLSRWYERGELTRTGSTKRKAELFTYGSPPFKLAMQAAGMTMLIFCMSACAKQAPATFNSYGVDKGAGSVGIHTVLRGDTVYTVAKNYQLPMREIITLNNLQAPYILNAGYRMKLPPPNEYEVRAGDTINAVARLYEVSPNRLASLNNIPSPYNLSQGQILRLPTPSGQYAASQPAVLMPNQNTANASDVVQTARLDPVDREILDVPRVTSSVGTPDVPAVKPTVQEASAVTRTKVPKDTPKMASGKFMRPIDGKIISSYGPKADGLHNDGVNIKAVRGTPVRASQNGVVVYNGDDLEGYGNLVLIRHENKMMSAYAHLDKTLVKRGAKVVRGQSIGTVGSTGQVDTPQLHFEIRKGSTPLDPAKYL